MCRAARKNYLCTYTPLFDFHQFGFWDFLVYVICNSYHLMRRRRVFQIRFRRLQRLPTNSRDSCKYKNTERACQGSNDFPSRPARRGNGFAFNRLTCTSFSYARTYNTVIFSHSTPLEYGELIRSTNHTDVYACMFVLYITST